MDLGAVLTHLLLVLFSPLLGTLENDGPFTTEVDGKCFKVEEKDQRGRANNNRPLTILVEGNVGSGKSTLLEYFSNRPDIDVILEPVAEWQNVSGTDLLQLQFDNLKRWSGTFQFFSTLTRYRNDLIPTAKRARLMERSVYSGRYCFLESLNDSQDISNPEYLIMTKWFDLMQKQLRKFVKPDLTIYLKCDVDVLISRIRKRGRPEEANIQRKWLENLNRRHDDWLVHRNSSFPLPTPKVLVLDGNLPLEEFKKYLRKKEHEILEKADLL